MIKILFFLVIILAGCGSKSGLNEVSAILDNDNTHIINVDILDKQENVDLSLFFSTIEIIPLEISRDVLLSRVNKLIVYNDTLYVLDKTGAKGLFMFNCKGNYLGNIGRIGQGPGEYSRPEDFTIDIEEHVLYLLDSDRQQVHKYDLITNRYIESVTLEMQKSRAFHIQYWNKNIYSDIYSQKKLSYNDFMLCKLNTVTGVREDCWLSAKEYNLGWNELFFTGKGVFYSQLFYPPKFTQLFMNFVMEITDDGVRPFLKLESKNWLRKEELAAIEGRPDERYRQLLKRGWMYEISDVFEIDNLIYFNYKEGFDTYHVFYDKSTNKIVCSRNIINDLLFKKNLQEGVELMFGFADDKGIYAFVHPFAMSTLLKNIKDGIINEDCISYDKLKNLNEESNPVVFYLRK